jgi:hypothetical protein
MLRYLPALGEQTPSNELGLIPAAIGVTNGLRTSWSEVNKLMKGKKDNLFGYTWFKDVILRPTESTIVLFDSGLFSVFGLVKKDKSFDVARFFESYAPAYKDYINLVLSEVPEASRKHCFFVNLDTEFLFGLEKTRQFNDMLLKNCPEGSIVGTYHVADGKAYLDELIEKFDFIAVGDGHSFDDDANALKYLQAACEYIKNKRPEIRIHVLGRSDTDLFKAVGNLADTCDSSSYRCFGDEEVLRETNLRFRDFWSAGFNYEFAGGIEKAKVVAGGTEMTEMQYSALIIELLKLYSFITALNKYSPQVVRSNCPVRDAIDDFFGVPHEWWNATGGQSARYLTAETKIEFLKNKSRQIKIPRFATEYIEGAADLGSLTSEYMGKRKQDWARDAKKPEGF